MAQLLNDELNLEILENICSGTGVSVNISALAKSLDRHRATIKTQVDALFDNNIITRPFYPFRGMFEERPLFAVVKADLPRNEHVERFLVNDENILAAFWSWDEDFNTLMFEFHKDLHSYYQWKEKISNQWDLPSVEHRAPADVVFFNNKLIIKYFPNVSIHCMEEKFNKNNELVINDFRMNELCFKILKKLLLGEGIRTNENELAKKMGTHRSTIERRITDLVKEGLVGNPLCKFPKLFVPPDFVLVVCMIRINSCKKEIFGDLKKDCNVPIAYEGHTGKYNLLYFGTFPNVEQHFRWEETIHKKYPDCFGAMKKVYLSPQMTASINQQKVALGVIRHRKELLFKRD